MPINIKEDIEIFLNKRYESVNTAYIFEKTRPSVLFDNTGNRPKVDYQFSTGQFTEEFGQWYQDYLAKIFGQESVLYHSNEINPNHRDERIFSYSIFGKPEELARKAIWWETQGIEKSDKNENQLIDLLRQHSDTLFNGHKVGDIFISGLFNRIVVIDFQPSFEDNDLAYEVFQKAQKMLSLNRAFLMARNQNDKIHQFWIELEKVPIIDVLRVASRNGLRLKE